MSQPDPKQTDFGFRTVPEDEKAEHVGAVFSSVAEQYDLMNDLMSAGLHRRWKAFAVRLCALRPGQRVLDVAAGTGDLAARLMRAMQHRGTVILSDINAAMLVRGRDRLLDEGLNMPAVRCDAERLPFVSDYFDCVTVGFGLRNVTRKSMALAEMFRVLRAGGRLVVLEFSRVSRPLRPLYDAYSFGVLPVLGRMVARDAGSYRYLAESIRMHPPQQELAEMIGAVGFERIEYFNLAAGVVAVHRGYKLG